MRAWRGAVWGWRSFGALHCAVFPPFFPFCWPRGPLGAGGLWSAAGRAAPRRALRALPPGSAPRGLPLPTFVPSPRFILHGAAERIALPCAPALIGARRRAARGGAAGRPAGRQGGRCRQRSRLAARPCPPRRAGGLGSAVGQQVGIAFLSLSGGKKKTKPAGFSLVGDCA